MNLVEFVERVNDLDEDQIIFQENTEIFESDIILEYGDDSYSGGHEKDGRKYQYLIEVAIAKEFIEDWLQSIDYRPTNVEIAKRLYEYAIYDA